MPPNNRDYPRAPGPSHVLSFAKRYVPVTITAQLTQRCQRPGALVALLCGVIAVFVWHDAPAEPPGNRVATGQKSKPAYTTRILRGRVVWLAEALARRFNIVQVPEAARKSLAIETHDGSLIPLAEDVRGRGFRRDLRLRKMDLELMVRIYDRSPVAQIVRVYSLEKERKFEVDYWCDICAIAMYELKPCECCQAEIELRKRPAR